MTSVSTGCAVYVASLCTYFRGTKVLTLLLDGRSNWLKGYILVALYCFIAVMPPSVWFICRQCGRCVTCFWILRCSIGTRRMPCPEQLWFSTLRSVNKVPEEFRPAHRVSGALGWYKVMSGLQSTGQSDLSLPTIFSNIIHVKDLGCLSLSQQNLNYPPHALLSHT